MAKESKDMRFIVGFLLGIAVGAAAGLLFAPQSGETTRAQLAERGVTLPSGININDEFRSRANEALAQGRELYTRTKGELSNRYSKAKDGDL